MGHNKDFSKIFEQISGCRISVGGGAALCPREEDGPRFMATGESSGDFLTTGKYHARSAFLGHSKETHYAVNPRRWRLDYLECIARSLGHCIILVWQLRVRKILETFV